MRVRATAEPSAVGHLACRRDRVSVELTAGEHIALDNLARKATGAGVGWINIADARALTEKGLCDRDRQGWRINAQGLSWLGNAPARPSDPARSDPIQLRP